MSLGTLLTLFVIPAIYSYVGQRHQAEGEDVQPPAEPAKATSLDSKRPGAQAA